MHSHLGGFRQERRPCHWVDTRFMTEKDTAGAMFGVDRGRRKNLQCDR